MNSGPEPKNFYRADIETLFPFNNHVKVQTCDSLVDVYQHTIDILFTYYYQFDQNPQEHSFLPYQVTMINSKQLTNKSKSAPKMSLRSSSVMHNTPTTSVESEDKNEQ